MKLKLFRPVLNSFPISSPFGMRTIFGKIKMHNGIDFATPMGTPVFAMISGRVFKAGYENPTNPSQGYGMRIWQEFTYEDDTYYGWYGHLSRTLVADNEYFQSETLIGFTGNSGRSTGAHLHCGVRKRDTGIYYDIEFKEV